MGSDPPAVDRVHAVQLARMQHLKSCVHCTLQLARDNVDSDLFGESNQGFRGFTPCDATVTTIKRETFKMLDAAHRADLVRLIAAGNLHAAYMWPRLPGGAGDLCRQAILVGLPYLTCILQGWFHQHSCGTGWALQTELSREQAALQIAEP